jgi:glycosyltransferase involved in cell wall biosynthesis
MNIAQFISHFPYPDQFTDPRLIRDYVCSGGEIAACKLAVHLARRGHAVRVFTSSVDGKDRIESREGLTIHRYGSLFEVGNTRVAPGLMWGPWREQPPADIVHVQHTTPPGGAAGLAYAKLRRRPLVVTHHGFERFENYGTLARRFFVFLTANFFVDALFAQSDALIAVSPFFVSRSRFLKKYPRKTVSIPNGVDLDEFRSDLSPGEARERIGLAGAHPVILYVGSLIPRKGVDVLIAAMRKVSDAFPDVELVLVGQGLSRESLERQAEASGLAGRVQFRGFVGDIAQKVLYYRAADVLAVPSVNDMEMFPLVLLEGSAMGCAMAVSDLETFNCIVRDGYNAVYTRAGDPDSLAKGILTILKDPGLKASLSANAERNAQKFSWKAVAQETEALYQRCLSGREPAG